MAVGRSNSPSSLTPLPFRRLQLKLLASRAIFSPLSLLPQNNIINTSTRNKILQLNAYPTSPLQTEGSNSPPNQTPHSRIILAHHLRSIHIHSVALPRPSVPLLRFLLPCFCYPFLHTIRLPGSGLVWKRTARSKLIADYLLI
jgi:hypothetical protein